MESPGCLVNYWCGLSRRCAAWLTKLVAGSMGWLRQGQQGIDWYDSCVRYAGRVLFVANGWAVVVAAHEPEMKSSKEYLLLLSSLKV